MTTPTPESVKALADGLTAMSGHIRDADQAWLEAVAFATIPATSKNDARDELGRRAHIGASHD